MKDEDLVRGVTRRASLDLPLFRRLRLIKGECKLRGVRRAHLLSCSTTRPPGSENLRHPTRGPGSSDLVVNFTDIPSVVDAFRALPYPYLGPPSTDPCK